MKCLLVVEDTRDHEHHGLMLFPAIVFQLARGLRAGEPVTLKRPDGSTLESCIGGFTVNCSTGRRNGVCLILRGVGRDDVPVGTEIWAASSEPEEETGAVCDLPDRVVVNATPSHPDGLAISVCFHMARKNSFVYPLFLGPEGSGKVSREELLRHFHQEWNLAMMDYVALESNFTGQVTVQVLSAKMLQDAMKAFKMLHKYCMYPEGYEQNLEAALRRGQDPTQYRVEVVLEYDSRQRRAANR